MPIRHGGLFEKFTTLESLYEAYLRARKGKRKKPAVEEFERGLGANLALLRNELVNGTYTPMGYKVFWVRDPKPRLIYAPHFRDVVVQHAIYREMYWIFDRAFCFDAYGCRVGKGNHRAADQAQRFLRSSPDGSYTLQLDIRKFFYSIDRAILMRQIRRKIKCELTLELVSLFADYPDARGVPIGNLLSQLFSSIYLHDLDEFVKRELRVKRYVRYVDDSVLFGITLDEARDYKERIACFLRAQLGLELSRWTVQKVERGVNFVGFRTWRRTRFIRKRSLYRFSRSIKKKEGLDAIVSLLGHARHTASYATMCARVLAQRPDLIEQLPEAVRLALRGNHASSLH